MPSEDEPLPASRAAPAQRTVWPAWASWFAAIVFFAGVIAVVSGTLLHLTRELVDLGHLRPAAGERDP